MRALTALIITISVLVVAAYIVICIKESDKCSAKGGKMVGTGVYTTTYVASGKVMIPITSEIMKCSK